jgi:hypothetical protein
MLKDRQKSEFDGFFDCIIIEGTSKNSMRLGPVRVCCPDGMILGD